jgi:predicted ester cyclase
MVLLTKPQKGQWHFDFDCSISAWTYFIISTLKVKDATAMTKDDLSNIYRDYIACLNKQDWSNLVQFVHEEVQYNDERIGLSGYREMLEEDFRAIPDLYFGIHLLVSEPPRIASRLSFDCTPKGTLFGIPVYGKRVVFSENVFYEFRDERIEKVWSVIDKVAIESQL